MIPERCTILVSGVPATGKSAFARHLASQHGFAHYDLESSPSGWPRTELKSLWDSSRVTFAAAVRQAHERAVLDWGFPPSCLSWVKELQTAGVGLVWFDGDINQARAVFARRGGLSLKAFDTQVAQLKEAGLPGSLNCVKVPALSASGTFMDVRDIVSMAFP